MIYETNDVKHFKAALSSYGGYGKICCLTKNEALSIFDYLCSLTIRRGRVFLIQG